MKNSLKKAFSLIEISIVIIIIGILISGITSGLDLYQEYKILTARNFTINSKVSRIPDIGFWLDTTRLKSIENAEGSFNPKNGDKIKNWYSINPLDFENKLVASQNSASLQPTYKENGLGGLPTILFEDNVATGGKLLSIPYDSMFSNLNFEIYVAIKSNGIVNGLDVVMGSGVRSQNGWTVIFFGDSANYYIQFYKHTSNRQFWLSPCCNAKVSTLKLLRFYISNETWNASDFNNGTRDYYGFVPVVPSTAPFYIGSHTHVLNYGTHYFNGEISEIIYFKRNLNNSERLKVVEYFNSKYK